MRLSKAQQAKVAEVRDERAAGLYGGGGYFVYLKPGWRLDDAHCFGEDTAAAVKQTLVRVQPCGCAECRA
jgi:hypothetical protein